MFLRVLGRSKNGIQDRLPCQSTSGCPDLLEMETGDFVAIGKDVSDLASSLPAGTGRGPGEKMVLIPRKVPIAAKSDIPSKT